MPKHFLQSDGGHMLDYNPDLPVHAYEQTLLQRTVQILLHPKDYENLLIQTHNTKEIIFFTE
ncbi:hypothetical protein D0437_30120 [Bacillus cereus]|uniref:Uncharacterized protein n=1 Tax=Bacillus cereus TaxID=1396 RepID=A0A9X7QN58_BACCE|nr:hypothetical protein D0437_30120 [Bacillus cereus]